MCAETSASCCREVDGALERIVGDVDQFEDVHWGRSPVIHRGRSRDHFHDVWSIAALDEFLVGAIRRPNVRIVDGGKPVAASKYTTRVRLGGSEFDDVIDPNAVARLFSAGATIVAQSIHRTHAGVRRFAEELAGSISHPIQVNSYFTPPGGVGLAPHADQHDVFVLQIDGSKVWRIDGLEEFELCAGDTAYIPAGTTHSAFATAAPSLHLTIGVIRVTYRAVLQRLLQSGPAVLGDALPLRYRNHSEGLASGIGAMVADVMAHLQSVDASAAAANELTRPLIRPPLAGALVAAASVFAVDDSTVITRSVMPWKLSVVADGRIAATMDGTQIIVPESCKPALDLLVDGGSRTVSELVGLDRESRSILARRLVVEGFCLIASAYEIAIDESAHSRRALLSPRWR